MVLRGQVQMALGMPSVKMSGGSGMGWAWLRATRRAVQAAMAAMAASRMSSTAAEDDPGLGEQAASADRPGPGALALVERAAGEGGEADLGVNLDHSRAGVADPGVDLKQLVPERERLRGHAAPVASCLTAVALAWSGASSAPRTGSHKDGPPLWSYLGACELVGAAVPGVGQADGHVDRHDMHQSVGVCGGDELVDVGRSVGGGGSAGQGDANPAGLAGIDS